MRISAVLACHNEERFIEAWLEETSLYADEILLAVHAPTDATADIIARFKPHSPVPIECLWFPASTVSRYGFSLMKNELIARATGDWITSIDADEEIGMRADELRQELETAAGRDMSSIALAWADNRGEPLSQPRSMASRATFRQTHSPSCPVLRKIKIFRNWQGYWWQGLIHEHITRCGRPAGSHCFHSNQLLHHYAYLNDSEAPWKAPLYAYLLCRIVDCPPLRTGTKSWWTDVVYPRDQTELRSQAKIFLQRQDEWFPEVPRRVL